MKERYLLVLLETGTMYTIQRQKQWQRSRGRQEYLPIQFQTKVYFCFL